MTIEPDIAPHKATEPPGVSGSTVKSLFPASVSAGNKMPEPEIPRDPFSAHPSVSGNYNAQTRPSPVKRTHNSTNPSTPITDLRAKISNQRQADLKITFTADSDYPQRVVGHSSADHIDEEVYDSAVPRAQGGESRGTFSLSIRKPTLVDEYQDVYENVSL